MKLFAVAILLLQTAVSEVQANSNDGSAMRAMRDEMKRTISQLQIENLEKPYYVEYSLVRKKSYAAKAENGAVSVCDDNEYVRLSVNVRIGDYKFDNSNFLDFSSFFFGSDDDEERFIGRLIPLDADYSTLRRELWLATDAAYKSALETYTKKVASLKNRVRKDSTPDFIPAKGQISVDTFPLPEINLSDFAGLCRDISAMYSKYPEIYASQTSFEYSTDELLYLNSEGVEMQKNDMYSGIEIAAYTQAGDGMPFGNFYSAYAINPLDLPKKDSLMKANADLIKSIYAIVQAPVLDEPYSGPMLFAGQAAGEIFAQIFAPQLIAQRDMLTEQGKQANERYSAFQNKIGGRVLPEFMSVSDDPTSAKYGKTPLFGNYKYDDQGMNAQKIVLVADGYLKNLLSGRTPTKRVKESNGHFRGAGPMISNLLVETNADHAKSYADMKAKMMKLCKDRELPYGIVIKKMMNPNIFATVLYSLSSGLLMPKFNQILGPVEAYRVYPDGREELVRGVDFGSFSPQSFKDVILCGKNKNVLNYYMSGVVQALTFAGSRYTNVSVVVPDLLFEDAEIKPNDEDTPKLPLYSNPEN